MKRLKPILITIGVLVVVFIYFWLDNRGLHDWSHSIGAQAQGEGLVPIKGAEKKSSDLINPISWFDPAPYELWFMPHMFAGSDRTRGGGNFAVRIIRVANYEPYREEFAIVYSPDRQSHAWLDLDGAEAKMESGDLEFNPNNWPELHDEILRLTKP